MLFNSIDFAIFLPIVFVLYWFVTARNLKLQNILVLVSSYVFYGWWDWRFLSLIVFSSFVDYFVGIGLGKSQDEKRRKWLLITSVVVNLGLLGFFKYCNFFLDNFVSTFRFFGGSIDPQGLDVILPVGISFYTFQTLSYSIDVYRRKLKPTKDPIAFFAFVSFFPQLVAGPIERATNLLPQFDRKRVFHYDRAVDGLRQILWGLAKKIVIADNCAVHANDIFNNYGDYSGSTLLLGAVFFALQIYGDFSGYSDIAIGTSRLFGFNLMRNFAFPYFSRDIAEFWRRWHISLSTWFRDYVYIPLGGSQVGTVKAIRNIFVIFIVSGFWHGANWTFVVWGGLNAAYFLPLMLMKKNRRHTNIVAEGRLLPTPRQAFQISVTFGLTLIAWVFFRADSLSHATHYLRGIFSVSLFSHSEVFPVPVVTAVVVFIVFEWLQRHREHGLQLSGTWMPQFLRWALYYGLVMAIFLMGGDPQEFVYFQF